MTQVIVFSLIGAAAGLGAIVSALPARLSLSAAVARAEGKSRQLPRPKLSDGYPAWRTHIGEIVLARVSQRSDLYLRLAPDIAIGDVDAAEIAFGCLAGALAGLSIGPLVLAVASATGASVSAGVPVIASLLFGCGGGALGLMELKSAAAKRRVHFVAVTASYLEWVSLCMAGGMGIEESLMTATSVSNDWALAMIRAELARASLASTSPWDALGSLGTRIGVPDLLRLRRTVRLAGTEGARVRDSVTALAQGIRDREADSTRKQANATSRKVFIANVILMVGFIAMPIYPAATGHL